VIVDLVTLFPEVFDSFVAVSFVARAIEGGQLTVRRKSPREFGLGKHQSVDDTPYGGGAGMVMRVDVMVNCIDSLDDCSVPGHRVLLSPQGKRFDQAMAQRFAKCERLVLVCGRYEGFDDRIGKYVDEEVSLGDFVMTGGEVAAMAIIDACSRLLPGVLGNAASTQDESHSPEAGGLLEYPQFTRPAEFRDARVPEVLLGGNHALIDKWRHTQAEERTRERRPDLWAAYVARTKS
jgi:tRNA (guanine37-N1)-methyltransferase